MAIRLTKAVRLKDVGMTPSESSVEISGTDLIASPMFNNGSSFFVKGVNY